MENILVFGFLVMPVLLGFLVWLMWKIISFGMKATTRARNWWRRIRKRPLVGQRIEPTI